MLRRPRRRRRAVKEEHLKDEHGGVARLLIVNDHAKPRDVLDVFPVFPVVPELPEVYPVVP
ncbi:MAG TPA: hypothetical protein VE908_00970, partial [Mycobacterium sp.]|nr:hypothetical protein [Mycobacterium sp.]